MITLEQKRRLKKLQVELNPRAEKDDYIFDELDRIEDEVQKKMKSMDRDLNSFFERMESVLMRKVDALLKDVESKLNSHQQEVTRTLKNTKGEFLSMIPDVDKIVDGKLPSVTKEIEKHKKATDQVIVEIQDEIRRSFSRLGGATKPLAHFANGVPISFRYSDINFLGSVTVSDDDTNRRVNITITGGGGGVASETPSGTVDGVNTSFTVQNLPDFILVSGQGMVSGDGFTLSGMDPYTVVFDETANPDTPFFLWIFNFRRNAHRHSQWNQYDVYCAERSPLFIHIRSGYD